MHVLGRDRQIHPFPCQRGRLGRRDRTVALGRDLQLPPAGLTSAEGYAADTSTITKGAKTVIIQVVNFNLKDLSDADYRSACDGLAPELARVPGLISKVWLADEASNTYGGVYTWVDQQAMDAFARSDFFKAFATNPNFANITSTVFGILEGPSQVTRASIAIAA